MSIATVALSPVLEESLDFPGGVIPIRVLESDSIASVKLKIQTHKGFFVKKQKLVFEGKELARNNSHVRDYGLADGNVLHLVLRLSDLQAISVRTVCGKEFEFHVERKRNVGYLKQHIVKRGKGFLDLKDHELIWDGEELEDQRLIDDICKYSDNVIHFLVRKSARIRAKPKVRDFEVSIVASDLDERGVDTVDEGESQFRTQSEKLQVVATRPLKMDFLLELIFNPNIKVSPVIKQLISGTFDGLEKGNRPVRSSEGSGGVYFMQDSSDQKYISVFKPIDEEPMAVNNPMGLPLSIDGEGLKKGTRVGEGALREVAAYILDHPRGGPRSLYNEEKGFAGVPLTVMVNFRHVIGFNYSEDYEYASNEIKIGSLQMFMENCGSCEDMGPWSFPVEEVHKISVLDLRLANTDRHSGNILVREDGEEDRLVLIPIDHGYCLPENFEDCTFDWLDWPQARQPYSSDTLDYIKSLDAEQDIELLSFYGWDLPCECARVFRISTMLLKKGAYRGLTPFAIGSILCRETLKKESVIEQIVQEAREAVLPGTSEEAFLESVSVIMDRRLDELSPLVHE